MNPQQSKLISDRIARVRTELLETTTLVAVSKFHSVASIREAYQAGQRHFGESRVQELNQKYQELQTECPDICWHFIGPLQSNKIKYIVPYIYIIESITSEKLLREVSKQAIRHHRRIPVLLEVHIAKEETKNGLLIDELWALLSTIRQEPGAFEGVELRGLMAMASFTEDVVQIRDEFSEVAECFQKIRKSEILRDPALFDTLSMGMSGDYLIAQDCGSTSVRIGSLIFGGRS